MKKIDFKDSIKPSNYSNFSYEIIMQYDRFRSGWLILSQKNIFPGIFLDIGSKFGA